uniref:ribonucleoside-diphosphate reductase n=1 Tax=viral metagenome TaxID=1070528 RepID=A0A6C0E8V0_9ZZZZ
MESPKSTSNVSDQDEMYVTKRNGQQEIVSFDKILKRIKKIGQEANIKINFTTLVMKVIDQLYNGISSTKLDELLAEQCASMASIHPDYNVLAGRVIVSNHHRNTSSSFFYVMSQLYNYQDKHNKHSSIITKELMDVVTENAEMLDNLCNYERDYLIDYFGFKTLERAYLMKVDKKAIERPQHMWLRVAIGIHGNNIEKICETYEYMSQKYFTHATPTLFNAGTPHPQLSSCFLLSLEQDSIEGIYNTLKDCALISKWAGGIGLHIHNVRACGSHIRGTNGTSNGIVPMLRVFNNTAKYVDQCVLPETIIYTTHGPKQIQHCVMNETEIYNLKGESEVIQNVLEHHYEGEVLEIETMHSIHNLTITPEHPVYVLRGQKKGLNYKVIKNRLDKKICDFEWVDAKDIDMDDMIVYHIPDFSKDISNISAEDCYVYGVILGDGSMSNKTDSCGYISMHTTNKKHILDFMINYFNDRCVNYKIETNNNTTRIRWNRCIHLPFRYNDFYDENKEKRMLPKWLNLPIEKSKYILKGLLETDGCLKEELVFDNTSHNLIESVRFLSMKLGVLTSGYIRDRIGESHETENGIIENKKISYVLRIPKTTEICELMNITYNEKQFSKFMRYDNLLLSRVQKITPKTYNGILYDLQMKKEHNYLLHNGVVHNGGGRRNGSFAIYLEPWHADIEMFLQMRKNHGDEELKARDLFYALWIPDLFMERVKTDGNWTLMCPDECPGLSDVYGDEFNELYKKYEESGKGRKTFKARDLWFQVLDSQMETGTPYLLYKDACNKKSNQKNIGTIKSSNLCVAPETKILTDKGHIEIKTLEGQSVNVWNGEEFSNVQVFKTGENQELIDVYTSDGCKLTCTKYHKFFIQNSYSTKSIKTVEAKDLKPNDKIIKCEYPVIDGAEKMIYPYTHGFFCGDGTYSKNHKENVRCNFKCMDGHYYCKRHIDFETEHSIQILDNDETIEKNRCNGLSYVKKPIIYLYDEKKELLKYMDYRSTTESQNRVVLQLPLDIEEKYFVPMNNSIKDKMEWFSGYCDADGCIANNQNNQQLQISSINREFLMDVKLMLQTCGVNPKIRQMRETGTSYLPDGKGGYKDFVTQPLFRLLITSHDLVKLVKLGFEPKRLVINEKNLPNRSANQFIKIEKILDEGRIDDTYCFTEPKKNSGIFNGLITSQCTEILEYSDDKETAVCNLASIGLPTFVNTVGPAAPFFDYKKLHDVAKTVTYNLNRIIDVNYYPTEKTRRSNMRHRPIGIGVQGLADVFMLMNIPFISEETKRINKRIFETIYHAALEQSCEMAITEGAYETFQGSPASQGILQFDMWEVDPSKDEQRYDWSAMKEKIKIHGLRNSLLLAPMPTASTSQILGFNECIEPITSNIYNRRTLAGEFILANKYLMNDLIKLELWNEKIKNNIIANHGSVQHIDVIPQNIRDKYKTVWEIPMRHLIDMAADRGAFICQSQSLNLWLEDPNYNTLTSMHFYSWSKGLKTGIYYLRRRGRHQAQQFTIEPEKKETTGTTEFYEEDEPCEMCSS